MALRKRTGLKVNQGELAKILGYSGNHISTLRQQHSDFPIVSADKGSNTFDTAEVIQWFIDREIRRRAGVTDPDGEEAPVKYNQTVERGRYEKFRADEKEIEVKVRLGQLMPIALVTQVYQALVGTARSRFLGIHAKVRSRYPEIGDDVMEEIQSLIHEGLSELGDPDAGLPDQLRDSLEKHSQDVASATEIDGEPVG